MIAAPGWSWSTHHSANPITTYSHIHRSFIWNFGVVTIVTTIQAPHPARDYEGTKSLSPQPASRRLACKEAAVPNAGGFQARE